MTTKNSTQSVTETRCTRCNSPGTCRRLRPRDCLARGAFEHSSAYRPDAFKAAALWLPPGVSPDDEALGAVMQEGVAVELQEEVHGVMEQAVAGHPPEAQWYLPAIGVEPLSRGMGYGSALLGRGLEVCDRDPVAAYLEATNPANIPLCQRFGFEITGQDSGRNLADHATVGGRRSRGVR